MMVLYYNFQQYFIPIKSQYINIIHICLKFSKNIETGLKDVYKRQPFQQCNYSNPCRKRIL